MKQWRKGVFGLLVFLFCLPAVVRGQEGRTLTGHTSWVECVAFSPDGTLLASGSDDNTIKLWNPATGNLVRTLTGHENQVTSIAFSPDGKILASGSWDETVNLWDLATGTVLGTLRAYTGEKSTSPFPRSGSLCVAFSPDGKMLASGLHDDTIKLWDPTKRAGLRTLRGHTDDVNSVAFSPDGKTIASGSSDNTIRLWDPATGDLVRTSIGHASPIGGAYLFPPAIESVAFSPDGKMLASGSSGAQDNLIELWDPATGNLVRTMTLTGTRSSVYSLAFSPDGKTLASAGGDATIKLWDPTTGNLVRTLTVPTDHVCYSVAFSPDGKTLAAGLSDETVKLWNVPARQALATTPWIAASLPTGTPPSTATPPAEVIHFGSYDLRKVALLKCASANDRPYATILLSRDGENWIMLDDVLIDSGADTSLFPASVAEALDIDLSQCPQGTPSGVGGTTTTYYADVYIAIAHMGGIEADIDGYILASGGEPVVIKALAAFSEDEANADTYLLGRRDVFDALALTFQGNSATIAPRSP